MKTRGFGGCVFAFLRARRSFAVGYAVVAIIIIVAVFAPARALRTDDGRSDRLSIAAGRKRPARHRRRGHGYFQPRGVCARVDLAIAIIGTLMSATIGGVIGAVVGYCEGQRAGAARSARWSCARPTRRHFRCSFLRSHSSRCSAKRREHHLAIAFVNTPIYLRRCEFKSCPSASSAMSRRLTSPARRTLRCAPSCDSRRGRAAAGTAFGQYRVVGAVDCRIKLRRRRRGGAYAGVGQHDCDGIKDRHWTVVAVVLSGIALSITVLGFALVGASVEVLADPVRRRVLSGSLSWPCCSCASSLPPSLCDPQLLGSTW